MLIRRTPLTPRSRPLRRLTPLRPVSDRMLASSPAVVLARERVEKRDSSCILCDRPGVDVHHRLPRGKGGARHDRDVLALSRLVWLCRDDHLWVEGPGCWLSALVCWCVMESPPRWAGPDVSSWPVGAAD